VQVGALAALPVWQEIFSRLHDADDGHIRRLREFAARYQVYLPDDV
jgi:hypothetical protein